MSTSTGSSRGVVDRTREGVLRVLLIAFGALAAIFAVLNSDEVRVRWIFGSPIQTPLILVILVSLLVGAIIGGLATLLVRRGR